jgi:hypothetical protein
VDAPRGVEVEAPRALAPALPVDVEAPGADEDAAVPVVVSAGFGAKRLGVAPVVVAPGVAVAAGAEVVAGFTPRLLNILVGCAGVELGALVVALPKRPSGLAGAGVVLDAVLELGPPNSDGVPAVAVEEDGGCAVVAVLAEGKLKDGFGAVDVGADALGVLF